MSTHQRHAAGRSDRRIITSRCRSIIVTAFTLPLLVAACATDVTDDSALPTPPVSQQDDDVVSETVGALDATDTPVADNPAGIDVDDESPDYTDAEIEVLLDASSAGADSDTDLPEPEPLEADSPTAAIEAIEVELGESGVAVDATPILDQVQPLDDAPTTAVFGIRDGRRINEAGEAIRLDDAAALACANVEIALTALDEGRSAEAADHLRAASVMGTDTTLSVMNPWSPILEQTAADVATSGTSNSVSKDAVSALLAFLTTCTQGGYEL